ncbi:uncharacterized protein A1O9_07550 [Exophiala aquamarina CBS 119918]|uniref:Xylanolytic transcriptional activator regulatory domain-containing protein n=1 Tax=Exophiala aquamarina CBS 119918 TaxID=1182545 RepID=A0A072PKB4_9EURO|nr:uncharacterized protein A1O9_07550 [Exophiala aquamarina CBS 119918]KEF55970.1 hypothetical protein A1O9_07550 [Exophiala aquamarina CBS 119918]
MLHCRKPVQEKEALKLRHELPRSINPQNTEPIDFPSTPTSLEPYDSEDLHEIPRYLSSETLKRKLVDEYVAYVHPICPVVDATTVQKEPIGFFIQQGKDRLSPLVFLSILYSAVPHISIDFLRAEGYESREELGEAIRADFKLAQDCGVKHDWKALVHAFLLMGSWHSPGTRSESWEWCGAAANLLDKHCDLEEREKPGSDQTQFRRLWWSCFVRDQLISLASQRGPSMKIHPKIAMILEKDLKTSDLEDPSNEACWTEYAKACGTRNGTQKLATCFVEFAKLSVILNRYNRAQTTQSCRYTIGSQPVDPDKISSERETTLTQLLSWYCRLHDDARYSRVSRSQLSGGPGRQDRVLQFHQTLLLIPYYLTLVRADDHSKGQLSDTPRSPAVSNRLDYARREVGKLVQDLIHNGDLRHVPTDLIESLLPFATTILLDSSHTTGMIHDPMQNRVQGFKQGMEVMRVMMAQKRLWAGSQDDHRIALLEAICRLSVELGGRPEDSRTETQSLVERSPGKNGLAATLAISALENDKEHLPFWPSSSWGDMLVSTTLTNIGLNSQHCERALSSEQPQGSHRDRA